MSLKKITKLLHKYIQKSIQLNFGQKAILSLVTVKYTKSF